MNESTGPAPLRFDAARRRVAIMLIPVILLSALCAEMLHAARVVDDLYAVTLPLAAGERRPGAATARRALEQVLVRVTGRRDLAASAPAIALLNEAERFVQQQGLASRREARYVFDGSAVRRAVLEAGLPYWDALRPTVLVLLLDDVAAPDQIDAVPGGPAPDAGTDTDTDAPPTRTPGAAEETPRPDGGTGGAMPRAPGDAAPASPQSPSGRAAAGPASAGPERRLPAIRLPIPADGRAYIGASDANELAERVLMLAQERGLPVVLPAGDARDLALLNTEASPADGGPADTAAAAGAVPGAARSGAARTVANATGAGTADSAVRAGTGGGGSVPGNDAGPVGDARTTGDFGPGGSGRAGADPFEALTRRYDADIVLLAEVSRSAGFVFVEWSLLADGELPTRWVGDADDGVEYLADLVAARYASRFSEAGGALALRIDAVSGASAYARTLAHLRRFALIEELSLERVEGGDLHFLLSTRAEAVKLGRLIDLADFLEAVPVDRMPVPALHFRFVQSGTETAAATGSADGPVSGAGVGPAGAEADASR